MSTGAMRFTEHIGELRKRLRVVALTFLVIFVALVLFPVNPMSSITNPGQYLNLTFLQGTVIAAFLGRIKLDLLPVGWRFIAATGVGEAMEIYIVASLLLALVLDMPFMAYELYKFIDPALSENERGLIYPFVTSTSALFFVGVIFGYVVIARYLFVFLGPFFVATGISPVQVDAASFYYVVFLILGATGVSFTSPVFVYTLIRLRIIEPDFFSKNRVVIWFVIWVITGLFLTPDGGPLLDLVIFLPIVAMVELAVFLGRRSIRGLPPKPKKGGGIVCPSCGKSLPRPMLFCEHCGKSIA